ncbi:hypothetical protein TREPR_0358 [Treponema primitia ZAS-2]|uniref:SGNH/GDSL hydrolase family protein n=1 Tax=Treponema primitia (strain ATCC BAA-887 / DSM 12427 / ZAS-2) TaxID=545694 RepID=F5YN24_TREPZ|nr:hypothetical protein [Treponema primitia]AEF84214.1 hypothetical protein TREPR_0358 [Treponema primitia ZAS-2]
MKKLFYKLVVLFFLLFIPMLIIVLLPSSHNNYLFAIIDKHQRLSNTESPRIVLAGGSNLAFGIDSKMMQETLNISVINTGIHVGIGLGRTLDDIMPYLSTGDILVIAPEYQCFTDAWNGSVPAYELIFDMHNYPLAKHSSFYKMPFGNSFIIYAKNKILALIPRSSNPISYSRDGFNEYGDYIKHLELENQPFESLSVSGKINASYLSAFYRIVDSFKKQGIQVFITYPSYEEISFQYSIDMINELDMALQEERAMTVISSPEDYCFPTNYFYDTAYHLNSKGREIRTARLVQDITRYIGIAN